MANIIHYNLKDSEFKYKVNDFEFVFSSELYKNKFISTYEDFTNYQELKLQAKYNILIFAEDMLLISLYKKIEKRGFLVYYKNIELNNDISFTIQLDRWYYGYSLW